MACLSGGENWVSLPKMLSRRVSLTDDKQNGDDKPSFFSPQSMAYRLEKVFPVYALGFNSKPELDSDMSVSDSDDPIWDEVRREAKLEAEREPILSSFLYASILAHDCLEQALGFVLANRLQNPTLLATQLMDIFNDVMMRDTGIQRSIRLDVQAFKDRDPSCLSYCTALLYFKGYHSLQVHRVAHALWNQGRKVLALALQSRISEVFGVDIHPAAKIGEGILLDHGTGVVIGETAVVGNRVSLMQVNSISFIIYLSTLDCCCCELSCDCSKMIYYMLPFFSYINVIFLLFTSMVAGIPAKVIGYVDGNDPSLTMKHDATKDFFEYAAVNFRDARSTGGQVPGDRIKEGT
ncbi:hypothetical protein FEM48_Zijuj08G0079400 [Ziziphus jujuba var. spinosa]|uniref:Serine acetyltransferase N-terminal domain-containing protein n=1 Tax=Ziziphus jujuba var. spinosa TaxID=714518 RepID=A0A978UXX0_ZIZJJ|nr:hypothetical protein FEM48_Zijuj08G0079400 [Ziziphus jujuba var. spinosa]